MTLRAGALVAVRILAATIVMAAAVLLIAILFGLPASYGLKLTRFREPTWALWGALALFAVARERPAAFLRQAADRAGIIVGSPRFLGWVTAAFLALYVVVSLSVHHSFHTFSHDFSMFDESLYQSHHGRFLYSPVLERSFLSEHFSPILAALVPIHALVSTPYLLVIANAALLWAAVFPLLGILDSLGTTRVVRHLAGIVYLANPITVSALDYGFHIESFLPVMLFGAYLAHRRGKPWLYAAMTVLTLAVKEDVGLYLVGLGAFLVFAERSRARGTLTAMAGASWLLIYLLVVGPALASGESEYRFLSRWDRWGSDPFGILVGMATHPIAWFLAMAAPTYLLFFWRLLFTPFWGRWGWLLVVIPWTLGATSGLRQQATLGLYYGLPLFAFAAIAASHGLASPEGKRILASPIAPVLAALAVVLNVAHFTIHPVPPERAPLLEALRRIPPSASIQAMPTLYPTLGYDRPKSVLVPGDSLGADYVVLRFDTTAWPFSRDQVTRLAEDAINAGGYIETFRQGTFLVLRRVDAGK